MTPARFISQGAIDVVRTVDFINGATFTIPARGQAWINYTVSAPAPVSLPEPASRVLGIGGLALCAILRRKLL